MTTSGSLDANVLLRLLLRDVPEQHQAAIDLLARAGRLSVADAALIEVIFVLGRAYGLTRSQQREATMGLLNQPQLVGNPELFSMAFRLYEEHPKLSFEDCYLVSQASLTQSLPLWTFDKKLAAQSDAKLLT